MAADILRDRRAGSICCINHGRVRTWQLHSRVAGTWWYYAPRQPPPEKQDSGL